MNSSEGVNESAGVTFSDLPEYALSVTLDKYFHLGTLVVALLGNGAALLTVTSIKPLSTALLSVAVLAVADCLAISAKTLYTQLTYAGVPLTDFGCQVLQFLSSFLVDYANWVVVVMTLERLVVVWYPLHVKRTLTLRRVGLSYFVLALILLPSSLCTFWIYEQITYPPYGEICYRKSASAYLADVLYTVEAFIYAVVPCASLLVANSLLIAGLRAASRSAIVSGENQRKRRHAERQLTVMLLLASVVFLILMMPVGVFFLVEPHWDYRSTPQATADYYLTRSVVYILADLNHAVNIFVYCLSGTKFRETFVILLRKHCRCTPAERGDDFTLSATVSSVV